MIEAVKHSNAKPKQMDNMASGRKFNLTEGAKAIAEERHQGAELVRAALSYLAAADFGDNPPLPFDWPFDPKSWRPEDRRNNLIRAGALIAAELDRMES